MKKPTAKPRRPKKAAASPHHAKPARHAKKAAPAKPAKKAHAAKPHKPHNKPIAHKLSRFGRRSTATLPAVEAAFVDLSTDPAMPPITDQGDGSCIAHASLALYQYATTKGHALTPTTIEAQGVQACLASGRLVAAGLLVYASFTSAEATRSGVVPNPTRRDKYVDGHYLVVVGIGYGHEWAHDYPDADPDIRYAKVRNSWGTDVGRGGYLLLPLTYLDTYSTELWTVGVQ